VKGDSDMAFAAMEAPEALNLPVLTGPTISSSTDH
jgi:hypothetical protein